MSGRILLIVEDKSDVDVVREILKAKQIKVLIKPYTSSSRGGLSRLVMELPSLLETLVRERQVNDCIAVLHDADENVQPDRRLYQAVTQICNLYNHVIEVVARDEIEAWVLADEGLCAWLGIRATNCDEMAKPSDRLNRLVKQKIGRDYSGSDRARVLSHLNGTGDRQSPSLRHALTHLRNAPCTKVDES